MSDCFNLLDCYRWAKTQCERRGLAVNDPENQRAVLGDAFDLICFPRFTQSEFDVIVKEVSYVCYIKLDLHCSLVNVNTEATTTKFSQDSLLTRTEIALMTCYIYWIPQTQHFRSDVCILV